MKELTRKTDSNDVSIDVLDAIVHTLYCVPSSDQGVEPTQRSYIK